ncbi:hypothetical protein [Thermaerobacillus caldiproteolyticus]|uniref:hypothetical protein n=1 Tax=Thermaerobacillus caldiproteolyticus TaxID=247480 RepID=UPI0018F15E00|nr:hypothetical protein [Anoxybacillus caldiproteolyticus]
MRSGKCRHHYCEEDNGTALETAALFAREGTKVVLADGDEASGTAYAQQFKKQGWYMDKSGCSKRNRFKQPDFF